MSYYLKQRQYAKKVYVYAFRLNFGLWSELPCFVDWQLLRRPILLLFLAHRRVLTTVILLPDPGWKQAGWFSLGHAQGSSMRAPSAGQSDPSMLRDNFFVMKCPAHDIYDHVTVDRGAHWEAGHWDGKDFKPFWSWLAEKNWSKEHFQTGDSGSSRHPHVCSPEGDVINEWCLRGRGSHFGISPQNLNHLSVCK